MGADSIEAKIQERVRGMIEAIVEEELEAALGAGKSQRVGAARTGYRRGTRERQLTTSLGKTTIMLPWARLKGADGVEREWHSRTVRRYQWCTERVDEALLGTYLGGINTRRLRGALAPHRARTRCSCYYTACYAAVRLYCIESMGRNDLPKPKPQLNAA